MFHLSDGVGRAESRQTGGTRLNFGPAKSVLTTVGMGSSRDIPQGRRNQNCHGISEGQNPEFERCVRHEVAWVAVLTNGIGTKLSVLPLIPYWDMRPE